MSGRRSQRQSAPTALDLRKADVTAPTSESYDKLVKQHFVALQALENLAWENERLQKACDSEKRWHKECESLEQNMRDAAEKHAQEICQLKAQHEAELMEVELRNQTALTDKLHAVEALHAKKVANIQKQSDDQLQQVRQCRPRLAAVTPTSALGRLRC
mgnify:CR=1 FL=1